MPRRLALNIGRERAWAAEAPRILLRALTAYGLSTLLTTEAMFKKYVYILQRYTTLVYQEGKKHAPYGHDSQNMYLYPPGSR